VYLNSPKPVLVKLEVNSIVRTLYSYNVFKYSLCSLQLACISFGCQMELFKLTDWIVLPAKSIKVGMVWSNVTVMVPEKMSELLSICNLRW